MEQTIKEDSRLQNIKYLTHFVTRAFLLAILVPGIIIFVLLSAYLVDMAVQSNHNQLKKPLFGAYVIVSKSMIPTIKVNDGIIIKRVDHDQYKIGDIITFSSADVNFKGLTITHRVVDKSKKTEETSLYTTKGDHNNVKDPVGVETNSIYGRVMFKIPKIGYMKEFFSKPSNFLICILVPALILLLYDAIRMYKIMNKRNEI